MDQQAFRDRVAEVAAETASPPDSLWWLSFCDADLPEGSQFLGACLVEASSLPTAITVSHLHGINPGGEIQIGGPIDPSAKPSNYPLHQLLSRADIERLDAEDGPSR